MIRVYPFFNPRAKRRQKRRKQQPRPSGSFLPPLSLTHTLTLILSVVRFDLEEAFLLVLLVFTVNSPERRIPTSSHSIIGCCANEKPRGGSNCWERRGGRWRISCYADFIHRSTPLPLFPRQSTVDARHACKLHTHTQKKTMYLGEPR